MFLLREVVSGVHFGELRMSVFGQQAFNSIANLNIIISAVNAALNDLNTKMFLNRKVIEFNYLVGVQEYKLTDPDLEQIILVGSKSIGMPYRMNSAVSAGESNRVQDIVQTLRYNTLFFPTPQQTGEVFVAHVRASMEQVEFALAFDEPVEQAAEIDLKLSQLIDLPRVFLGAIVQYVAYKIMQAVSPDIEGKKDVGEYLRIRYDAAVSELKQQGFGNSHLSFSTDTQFINSQLI